MSHESHDDSSKADSSNIPSQGETEDTRLTLLKWLLFAVFVLTVLALLWAHSPARIRLIGLFSLLYGLVAGWILGATARYLDRPVSRNVVLLTCLLIAVGETGWTFESYRVYVNQLRQVYERDVPQMITPELFKQQDPENENGADIPQRMKAAGTLGDSIQEARQKELAKQARFSLYLQQRIAPLVKWSTPFPEIFWACEILLGSLAGAWIFRLTIRSAQPLDEDKPFR